MKKVFVSGRRIVQEVEENIYELEIPDNISCEEQSNYILSNVDKLKLSEIKNPKKILFDELIINEISDSKNDPSITHNTILDTYVETESYVDHIVIKETLSQFIIKNNFKQFKEFFVANKSFLKPVDYYVLLNNSLNTGLIDFSILLLSNNDLLNEDHIIKILPSAGIINNDKIISEYIRLGYDKIDFDGRSLKDLYNDKGFNSLLHLFDS